MTQLRNETGQTIGYFLTVAELQRYKQLEEEHRRLQYAWAKTQFSDEELARAEQETEEYTTEEVLRHLKTRRSIVLVTRKVKSHGTREQASRATEGGRRFRLARVPSKTARAADAALPPQVRLL